MRVNLTRSDQPKQGGPVLTKTGRSRLIACMGFAAGSTHGEIAPYTSALKRPCKILYCIEAFTLTAALLVFPHPSAPKLDDCAKS